MENQRTESAAWPAARDVEKASRATTTRGNRPVEIGVVGDMDWGRMGTNRRGGIYAGFLPVYHPDMPGDPPHGSRMCGRSEYRRARDCRVRVWKLDDVEINGKIGWIHA